MAKNVDSKGKDIYKDYTLTENLMDNIKIFQEIFKDDGMFRYRICKNSENPDIMCCAIFIDGMTNSVGVSENIIKPLVEAKGIKWNSKVQDNIREIYKKVLYASRVQHSNDIKEIVESIIYGDTLLMAQGSKEVLIIDLKGWETRSPTEPENEKTMRGPREGFTEAFLKNTSFIRRRLRTPDLKFKLIKIGTRTNTQVCLCYLDTLVNPKVLARLEDKLKNIEIDGILDTNYLDELTKDNPYTPLKTSGVTERPDIVAGKLLEGRIAVIVDGSPSVMTVPYFFIENLQTDDDYYINYFFAGACRLIRILSLMITIVVPALYIALVAFHKEMIPINLALSISEARQGVPLPIVVECLVMLLVFEILRESGMRIPSNVGTALSIVGAIVIGQAAVDAKFVSAPMVIVVSVTGITGLMAAKMKGAVIIYRTFLVIMASVLGMYGLIVGLILIVAHTVSLTSFGVKYTSYLDAYKVQEMKDIYVRYPWWKMLTRPRNVSTNLVRQSNTKEGGDI
ncbi:MAG: spore germination protein [Clostridia bacterium]|nr:spore germination protein [Clostridia bacterium]